MSSNAPTIESVDLDARPGDPLAPWTYLDAELFDLEYEALFLERWQFAGHLSDVPEPGDFMTGDIGRDNVVVLRDKDGELHAFLNVCRHRASRIFEGRGNCKGVIRCPYHGWTYRFDGSLMAIPQEENFPGIDRSRFGLHRVQLEVFHGLVFVRVRGDGPGVAEQFAHTGRYFDGYGIANYVQIAEPVSQVWDVNWKVAWDNYQENYHIPIGHPGLHRLLVENDEFDELTSGVNFGVFLLRDKPSKVTDERRYQELAHHADYRVPEELRGKWVQFGMSPGLGIDLYPELLDLFQIIPLGPERTLIRAAFYGPPDPTPAEQELRDLNLAINNIVNDEDRELCTRVQLGLRTTGYRPGPLAQIESGVFHFHRLVRDLVPVAALAERPNAGQVATENERLKSGR